MTGGGGITPSYLKVGLYPLCTLVILVLLGWLLGGCKDDCHLFFGQQALCSYGSDTRLGTYAAHLVPILLLLLPLQGVTTTGQPPASENARI